MAQNTWNGFFVSWGLKTSFCSNDKAFLFDYLNYCYLNLKLNLSYWSTWKFISKIEFFYQIKICLFFSILPLVSNSSSNSLDLCPTTREAKTCQVYFSGNCPWYHLFYFKGACTLLLTKYLHSELEQQKTWLVQYEMFDFKIEKLFAQIKQPKPINLIIINSNLTW